MPRGIATEGIRYQFHVCVWNSCTTMLNRDLFGLLFLYAPKYWATLMGKALYKALLPSESGHYCEL